MRTVGVPKLCSCGLYPLLLWVAILLVVLEGSPGLATQSTGIRMTLQSFHMFGWEKSPEDLKNSGSSEMALIWNQTGAKVCRMAQIMTHCARDCDTPVGFNSLFEKFGCTSIVDAYVSSCSNIIFNICSLHFQSVHPACPVHMMNMCIVIHMQMCLYV